MASPAIEQLRAERAAQRAASGYKEVGYVPPNTNPKHFGVEITPDTEEKTFGQKVVQDAALLAYGVPTAVAQLGVGVFTDPIGTAKIIGGGIKQTVTDIAGATGVLGEGAKKESLDYYRAHPLFAALDAFGIASLGTGIVLKGGLTATARSAISAAVKAGAKEGIEESVINAALRQSRSAISPKRIVGIEETKIRYPFVDSIRKVVRTGKTDDVVRIVSESLIGKGVKPESAVRIAQAAAIDTANSVSRKALSMKALDTFTHPVGAAISAGRRPAQVISRAILGTPEQTAVGRLFGNEIIQTNKKSAFGLERWLEAVAIERGLENTVETRARILMEWKKSSDFANLTPEQLFRDFDNYVKADVNLRKLRDLTGENFVATKALQEKTTQAMVDTINENVESIIKEVGEMKDLTPEKQTDMVFMRLSEFMGKNYGNDFLKYAPKLREAFGSAGSIKNLNKAILALSSRKPTISFMKWSKEARDIATEMEGTGYRIGHAPTGKKITQVADVIDERKAETLKSVQFVSPNIKEGLDYKSASTNLKTKEYAQNYKAVIDSYSQDGLQGRVQKGIGDWSDGAEETYIKEITNEASDEQRIYALAKNARALQQKDAIDFKLDVSGKDELFTIKATKGSLDSVRELLNKEGITFKTLGEDSVYVVNSGEYFDAGMLDKFKKLENTNDIKVTMQNGIATFITKVDDRIAAQKIYDDIINNFEKKYGDKSTIGGEGSSIPGESIPGREGRTIEEGFGREGLGKASEITESLFDAQRTYIGNVLEKFGFSTRGTIEGTNEFIFRQSWTQNAITALGEKFGGVIKINKPVGVTTTGKVITSAQKISIPVEKLYEWLYNHRSEIFAGREGVGAFKAFRPVSVFDITTQDLIHMGFDSKIAKEITDISRDSLRSIPTSVLGIGEKLVNLLRTADTSFGKFGKFYDTFLKSAYYMRYQSGLSVMFQAQQYIETRIMSSMLTRDAKLLPGVQGLAGFGERLIPEKVGGILKNAKTYLQKITKDPDLNELIIARDELLPNVRRALEDTMGTPEFTRIRGGIEEGIKKTETRAEILSRQKVEAFWMQMFGGWSQGMAAKIGKAIAEKFDMSLEEATSYTMRDGQKIYKHPRLVQDMQNAVQQTLHYKVGFQTSPLAKTLNIVFFPFRFQAKTIAVASNWLGTLSPVSRAVIINNLVHFSNWAGTDEGIEWRKTHQSLLYSILAYTTAWEQMGDSIDSIARGRLFGGQTGLIGGVPFGFIYNIAQNLAVLPDDPEQVDPATGRLFRFKEVPKELVSDTAFMVALEEFVFTLLPGLPLYTVTGGVVKGASYRNFMKNIIESGWGWSRAKIKGEDEKRGKEMMKREFMRVPFGETRF